MRGKRVKLLKKIAVNEFATHSFYQTRTTPRMLYKRIRRLYKSSPRHRLDLQKECRVIDNAWRLHLAKKEECDG